LLVGCIRDLDLARYCNYRASSAATGKFRRSGYSAGITVAFARVRDVVRDDMRLAGIEAVVGSLNFHERITDGVFAWQQYGRSIRPSIV
jgi:hypothetical protein